LPARSAGVDARPTDNVLKRLHGSHFVDRFAKEFLCGGKSCARRGIARRPARVYRFVPMSDLPLGDACPSADDEATPARPVPPSGLTPLDAYEARVGAGALADDPGQRRAMQRLQQLSAALSGAARPC
jgi:hypothetical protein